MKFESHGIIGTLVRLSNLNGRKRLCGGSSKDGMDSMIGHEDKGSNPKERKYVHAVL